MKPKYISWPLAFDCLWIATVLSVTPLWLRVIFLLCALIITGLHIQDLMERNKRVRNGEYRIFSLRLVGDKYVLRMFFSTRDTHGRVLGEYKDEKKGDKALVRYAKQAESIGYKAYIG